LISEHAANEPFMHVFWLILLGGLVGLASAFAKQHARKLAVTGAVMVYIAFATVLVIAALILFATGTWIALGAGAVALVVALLASRTASAAVPEARVVADAPRLA
jgi:hypothetical protein